MNWYIMLDKMDAFVESDMGQWIIAGTIALTLFLALFVMIIISIKDRMDNRNRHP